MGPSLPFPQNCHWKHLLEKFSIPHTNSTGNRTWMLPSALPIGGHRAVVIVTLHTWGCLLMCSYKVTQTIPKNDFLPVFTQENFGFKKHKIFGVKFSQSFQFVCILWLLNEYSCKACVQVFCILVSILWKYLWNDNSRRWDSWPYLQKRSPFHPCTSCTALQSTVTRG